MLDNWDINDLYKALFALAAGVILGSERELKDKAAGLKTITIICIGSTLFSIISYKAGLADNETTRIASYVVSGIGFIGAGVIFKDGVNVSGLTTASIIWLASAVGMAIGFGEYFLAATFIVASLFIIFSGPMINRFFLDKRESRMLCFCIDKKNQQEKDEIISAIRKELIKLDEERLEMKDDLISVTAEVSVNSKKLKWLEQFLINHPYIVSFTM